MPNTDYKQLLDAINIAFSSDEEQSIQNIVTKIMDRVCEELHKCEIPSVVREDWGVVISNPLMIARDMIDKKLCDTIHTNVLRYSVRLRLKE